MAAAAESASNSRSPRSSGFSADSLDSPRFHRDDRNLSSPWAHDARGEPEMFPVSSSSPASSPEISPQERVLVSDCYPGKSLLSMSSPDNSVAEATPNISDNGNNNVAREKKPVWNKLSNGAVENGPVMGAESWPALSDSNKASPKASSDSLKALSDGPGPVIESSLTKQVSIDANPISTTNHAFTIPPKSIKGGRGGGVGRVNGSFSQPQPTPPPQRMVEMPQNNSGNSGPMNPNSSPRVPHKINSWESGPRARFISQPHIGNDHPRQRNSSRRGGGGGGGGSHLRGDASYHSSHGGRHNYDGNPHRNFNGRGVHIQQQRVVPRNFIRPPPPSTALFSSPPVGPFGNPMGYPDMSSPVYYVPVPSPESFGGVPFVHAAPFPMFLPTPDTQLQIILAKQIDYYFSYENLCKDTYLRKNMDEEGWVPISLIATFNRVRLLTDNMQFILDAVRTSTVVEVQGDKIRKRNDWMSWPLPSSNRSSSAQDSQSRSVSNHNMLANSIQSIGLGSGKAINDNNASPSGIHKEAVLSRSSSGDLNMQSQSSSIEGQAQLK